MTQCAQHGISIRQDALAGLCPMCLLALGSRRRRPVTVAGYRLVRPLGRGGTSRVYEAVHVISGKRVALKLIGKQCSPSIETAHGVRNDMRRLAALDHSHIVPLYGGGVYQGRIYYTMPLMRGGTLAARLADFEAPEVAARVVAELARGVQHAHEKGILHRDLKPENVLLDAHGSAYVADFGISCATGELRVPGLPVGTPGYLAPEYVLCESSELTAASDTFSLGVILYELLSGQVPFPGNTLEDYRKTLEARLEPLPLHTHGVHVDAILEKIALKALARRPGERYASPGDLAKDLEAWDRGEETTVHPPQPRWLRTLRSIGSTLEVRLILLGLALAFFVFSGKSPIGLAQSFATAMTMPALAPICAAMGFAAVMTATRCDRHLVRLLLSPVRRVRWLVLPGGILVAYVMNVALPSQTSTAAALGSILVPLLRISGYSPTVIGAALVLGASFGGDLLNPASRDLLMMVSYVHELPVAVLSKQLAPASIAGVLVATLVFALLHRRERRPGAANPARADDDRADRVDLLRAAIPLLPVALLFAAYTGAKPFAAWIETTPDAGAGVFPVVCAMLIGTAFALLVGWRDVASHSRAFFEGTGFSYANIISLTIAAKCFGDGIKAAGLGVSIVEHASHWGWLHALSIAFTGTFAVLSGSGSGPTQVFADVALSGLEVSPHTVHYAALACLSGAFGRTMSPVAAVVLYTSLLVGASPLALVRTLLPALAAGAAVSFVVACL